jgi:hypothetical protein
MGELTMDTYYADPLSLNVMTAIAQNLKDNLGLTVKPLQITDGPAWQKLYYTDGLSQMSFWGGANGPTGDRGYGYFHSSAAHPTGSNGWKDYSYNNPTVYQQVCEITKDELPALYLWETVRFHVVSKKVGNMILIPAAGGGSYYDAAELWTITE